jgi:outer membrane protein assembly factor BamE (lipoprotein component of BamABCDE complex)
MKKILATFKYMALAITCFTLCVECVSTSIGTDFNSANINQLKAGETTEQDVIRLIGQPRQQTRSSDGTVTLSYMYDPGQTITPFSGFDPHLAQKAGAQMKTLEVILDANGKVKSFTETGPQ